MARRNVIIIGAGLFGSIAATLARRRGHNVTVIDAKQEFAASLASGCVMAPSWLLSMPRDRVDHAYEVLHELYTVHPLEFKTNLLATFKAQYVHPDEILVKPDVVGEVKEVDNGKAVVVNKRSGQSEAYKGAVLVAAGFWSNQLVDTPPIRGLWGASLRIKGHQIPEPTIKVYAPYKQAVGLNLDNKTVWFGDGTALIEKTWEKEARQRIDVSIKRAREYLKLPKTAASNIEVRVGVRPYVDGFKHGYFAQTHPNTWVSTGGAKNGMALAAWQAYQFVEEAL